HTGRERYPIPIRLELAVADKADLSPLLSLDVRAPDGTAVRLSELVKVCTTTWDGAIYHKDLLPVAYVTGDMAGRLDSPLYGMFSMVGAMSRSPPRAGPISQHLD